ERQGHSVSAAGSGPKPQYRGPEEDEGQREICDPTAHALRLHVQHGTVPLVKGPQTPCMGLEGLHVPCPLASCPPCIGRFQRRGSWARAPELERAPVAGGPIKWARKRLNRQRRPCRGSVAGKGRRPCQPS